MSIRKRGNSWLADLTSPNTARYRRQFQTKEAAELWEMHTKLAFAEGRTIPPNAKAASRPDPVTLQELIDRTWSRFWKDAKSKNTIKSNIKTLVEYFGGDKEIKAITSDSVEDYTEALESKHNYPPATINRKLATLSRLMIFAHRRGWISSRPDIPRKREPQGRVNFYTPQDRKIIHSTFKDRGDEQYALLFDFLCDTGLRLGEALDLEWKDTLGGRVTVWEHKGAQPGGIPLTALASEILKARGELVGNLAGPWADMTKHTCRYAWEKQRMLLDKRFDSGWVWHTCRHTFCSRLVQAGVPLKAVKDLARHQSIDTTIRYSHLAPKDLEAAVSTLLWKTP